MDGQVGQRRRRRLCFLFGCRTKIVEGLKDDEDAPGLRDEGGIGVAPKEPRFSSESSMATAKEPSSSGGLQQFLRSDKHGATSLTGSSDRLRDRRQICPKKEEERWR